MSELRIVSLADLRVGRLLFFLFLVLVSTVATAATWTFMSGRHYDCVRQVLQGNEQRRDELHQSDTRDQQVQHLEAHNRQLYSEMAVNQGALEELRAEMDHLHETLYRRDEELRFYHSIASNTKGASGLKLHGVHVEPVEDEEGRYLCKIFLTHFAKNVKLARGRLELRVEGAQAGEQAWLDTADLLLGGAGSVPYEFRHFLSWESHLFLPEGFQPAHISVRVVPEGRGLEPLEESYDWPLDPAVIHVN